MAQQTEFIPYEQALELKELGYDIPSISSEHGHVWEREILYQQAFRWFREKYNLYHFIEPDGCIFNAVCQHTLVRVCRTYEEAELACLKKLIEIVKNK